MPKAWLTRAETRRLLSTRRLYTISDLLDNPSHWTWATQAGCTLLPSVVICRGRPTGSVTKICLVPVRFETNARTVPSGDQHGDSLFPSPATTLRGLVLRSRIAIWNRPST